MSQPISNKSYEMALYRLDNPCSTLQQIGDKFGVSREAVRQVLVKLDVPTKHLRQTYICLNCGSIIKNHSSSKGKPRKFCDNKCYHEWLKGQLIPLCCNNCGILFYRRRSEVIGRSKNIHYTTDNVFCSKKCQGQYVGKHYGRKRSNNNG